MSRPTYSKVPLDEEDPRKDVEAAAQTSEAVRTNLEDILRIGGVVTFYFVVSISLVFLNKHVMSTSDIKMPYPIFVTWFQLVVAIVCLVLLMTVGRQTEALSFMPPLELKMDVMRKVLPLTGLYVGMLTFTNFCLQHVEMTFFQVARCLTIVFNIILSYYMLGQTTSTRACIACVLVTVGFVAGSLGELNFSLFGLIMGVMSSILQAMYSITVKSALAAVDNNEWKLMLYNNFSAAVLLIPIGFIFGEVSLVINADFIYESAAWMMLIATGLLGFGVNLAMFLQIKYTSPLTNTLSGTAKAASQTILAWMIWRNPISTLNCIGLIIIIGGSGWYSIIRYEEMQARKRLEALQAASK